MIRLSHSRRDLCFDILPTLLKTENVLMTIFSVLLSEKQSKLNFKIYFSKNVLME